MIRSQAAASRTPARAVYVAGLPPRSLTHLPVAGPAKLGQGADSATAQTEQLTGRNSLAGPPCVITRYR